MILGFDNSFILDKIFGDNNIFIGSSLDNVKYHPLGFRVSMEILTKCKVVNPPKKWGSFDIICLNIDLFGVTEFQSKINNESTQLEVFTISKSLDVDMSIYWMNILGYDKSTIDCNFVGGIIQRIIPLRYNYNHKYYEKA